MDTAIAVSDTRLGDLLDPLPQFGLIGLAATVVVTGTLRPKNGTGPADADLPCASNIIDQLPSPIRP